MFAGPASIEGALGCNVYGSSGPHPLAFCVCVCVQLPLPYLKAGFLTVPPNGNTFAPHADWKRKWFVLDQEELKEVRSRAWVSTDACSSDLPAGWLSLEDTLITNTPK